MEGECVMLLAGKRLQAHTDAEWLQAAEKIKKTGRRRVTIYGTTATPYRCVGGTIFQLQRAGLKVGFVSEPPSPDRN